MYAKEEFEKKMNLKKKEYVTTKGTLKRRERQESMGGIMNERR